VVDGTRVIVTVPDVARSQVVGIIATFLCCGPENGAKNKLILDHMKEAFSRASALRLVIATDNPNER
jgi:hypothetical protein